MPIKLGKNADRRADGSNSLDDQAQARYFGTGHLVPIRHVISQLQQSQNDMEKIRHDIAR